MQATKILQTSGNQITYGYYEKATFLYYYYLLFNVNLKEIFM